MFWWPDSSRVVRDHPFKTSLGQINKTGDLGSNAIRLAVQSAMEEKLKKDFANSDTVGNVGKVKNDANDVGGDFSLYAFQRTPGLENPLVLGMDGTTEDQNYNPLRNLQDQKYKRDPSIQLASLNQRLFPEMASKLERLIQRKISGNPGFFRIGRTKKRSPGIASDIWGQTNNSIDTVKKIPIQFGKVVAPEKRIQDFKILNEKVEQYFNEKPEPKLQDPSEGSIPLYFNLPTLPQVIYSSLYGNGAPAMFTS